MPAPYVTRLSREPVVLSSPDASNSPLLTIEVRRQSQEMSDYLEPRVIISDYLEPVTSSDRQNGYEWMGYTRRSDILYERIDEEQMVGLQDGSRGRSSYADSDYLNPERVHESHNGPVYEQIDDCESV